MNNKKVFSKSGTPTRLSRLYITNKKPNGNCIFLLTTSLQYMLVDKAIIEDAASDAYNDAITDIAKFYTEIADGASFEVVQDYLKKFKDPDTGDSLFYVQAYDSTFHVIDHFTDPNRVSKQKVIPARYGKP